MAAATVICSNGSSVRSCAVADNLLMLSLSYRKAAGLKPPLVLLPKNSSFCRMAGCTTKSHLGSVLPATLSLLAAVSCGRSTKQCFVFMPMATASAVTRRGS